MFIQFLSNVKYFLPKQTNWCLSYR